MPIHPILLDVLWSTEQNTQPFCPRRESIPVHRNISGRSAFTWFYYFTRIVRFLVPHCARTSAKSDQIQISCSRSESSLFSFTVDPYLQQSTHLPFTTVQVESPVISWTYFIKHVQLNSDSSLNLMHLPSKVFWSRSCGRVLNKMCARSVIYVCSS